MINDKCKEKDFLMKPKHTITIDCYANPAFWGIYGVEDIHDVKHVQHMSYFCLIFWYNDYRQKLVYAIIE